MWLWLGVGMLGLAAVIAPAIVKTSGDISARLTRAARKMPPAVVASAKRFAAAKGLPLVDVMATILLESGGNPKAHKNDSVEDSRGLMQVNVRAHPELLKRKGMTPADLFDVDHGIDAGTDLLLAARNAVKAAVAKSRVPQSSQKHDLSTLTRLYYAGPKYVLDMLKRANGPEDTAHVFKRSEVYVDHWQQAVQIARAEGIA